MHENYRFEFIRPHDPAELAEISALLRAIFPKARHLTPRYLAWQYAANPDGEAVGCNAWAGDRLVGHLGAIALAARVEGEAQSGALLLNSAVDAGHRRRGLQSALSKRMFEVMVARGYRFCISTGNRFSIMPLLSKSFRMLRPLEARIGFGTPGVAPHAVRPSFERVWSDEAMRWRLANPEACYATRASRDDLLILADSRVSGIAATLYSGPNAWGVASGGEVPDRLRLWIGADPNVRWSRSAFLPIPLALRPAPLHLVYRDLTGGGFAPDPERLLFRALDFDAY
ncbi:MAG: GNAT family N-acetyltransferase [Allosphingosinicella sp.]